MAEETPMTTQGGVSSYRSTGVCFAVVCRIDGCARGRRR